MPNTPLKEAAKSFIRTLFKQHYAGKVIVIIFFGWFYSKVVIEAIKIDKLKFVAVTSLFFILTLLATLYFLYKQAKLVKKENE